MAAEIITAGRSSFFLGIDNSPGAPRAPSLTCSFAKSAAFRSRTSRFTARMNGSGGDDEKYPSRRPLFSLPKIQANPTAVITARSAMTLFALGFVDAGYSGDWSRIGAISKEVEDWLKVAAFFVVPLCVLLVVSISSTEEP